MPLHTDIGAMSHPYGGKRENLVKSQDVHATLIDRGYSVISLLNLSTGVEAERSEPDWLRLCLRVVRRCDYLMLTGDWRHSRGCRRGYRWARLLGKPIYELRGAEIRCLHWARSWAVLPRGWRLAKREDHEAQDLELQTPLGESVRIGPGTIDAETSLSVEAATQCIQLAYGVGVLGSESVHDEILRRRAGL